MALVGAVGLHFYSQIWELNGRSLHSLATGKGSLKNRESIHFAKFAHDICANTFFLRIDSFYESILRKIRHIPEHKGCQICIMDA